MKVALVAMDQLIIGAHFAAAGEKISVFDLIAQLVD